jgi:hypothetical protein
MTPKRLVQRNDIGRFWLIERDALVESRQLYGVWMYELYRYTAGIDYVYLKKKNKQRWRIYQQMMPLLTIITKLLIKGFVIDLCKKYDLLKQKNCK